VAGEVVGGEGRREGGVARLLGRREEVDRYAASEVGAVAVRSVVLTGTVG